MDPQRMAGNDGSAASRGRGSGLQMQDEQSGPRKNRTPPTPYMQMTFAPLERRLDTAVWRALFASSTRQARQFVIHGSVTVNGKRMRHPGYLLNPGDMFQVHPDRVLFATGQTKGEDSYDAGAVNVDAADETLTEEEEPPADTKEQEVPEAEQDPRKILKQLGAEAKGILAIPDNLSAKRKQDLRAFQKSVKTALSRPRSQELETDTFESQFSELKELIDRPKGSKPSQSESSSDSTKPTSESSKSSQTPSASSEDPDLRSIRSALNILFDNPVNEKKPYATPWQPRDYMSAFAFIPRYLEVNQNICAAVYLRHPVARPGLAEVPTPFGDYVNGSAFAWYLRRR
ncbi:MAG: hypothetical protein Q9160_007736 [Pyrenula sp. 1 TL-2023]